MLGAVLSTLRFIILVLGGHYGWPKNLLHWAGIHESILDICATVRPHFVIADGIVAMDGDGPLNGVPKFLNSILLADDLVAADAILTRLLGVEWNRIMHIIEFSTTLRYTYKCNNLS